MSPPVLVDQSITNLRYFCRGAPPDAAHDYAATIVQSLATGKQLVALQRSYTDKESLPPSPRLQPTRFERVVERRSGTAKTGKNILSGSMHDRRPNREPIRT